MTKITKEIEELTEMETPELRDIWRRIYQSDPPPRNSRDLLIRAAAYWMQEQECGRLSKAVKRRLRVLAEKLNGKCNASFAFKPSLKPGAKLIREWRGKTYSVIALEDGFDFEGRPYSSLSKIAREITGVRWSGPRFFGLTGRGKVCAHGKEASHA